MDYIRIRRSRPWVRNDFQPVFFGNVSDDEQAIVGTFEQWPSTRRLIAIMLGLFGALIVPLEVAAAVRDGLTREHAHTLLTLLGMMGFALALPWMGWWMAHDDITEIERMLRAVATGVSA